MPKSFLGLYNVKHDYWSLNKLNWNRQHCFLCVLFMSNWDSVEFAISQIGFSQIQKGLPDLHRRRRRSVSKIVVNHLLSIQADISTTSPRRNITKIQFKKTNFIISNSRLHLGWIPHIIDLWSIQKISHKMWRVCSPSHMIVPKHGAIKGVSIDNLACLTSCPIDYFFERVLSIYTLLASYSTKMYAWCVL